MISTLGDIVLNFVVSIINLLLMPIDLLISQFLPSIENLFNYLNSFISLLINNIAWAVDSLCLPNAIIIIITDYLIFRLTFPYLLWFIKLAIKWYNNLKL